MNYKRGTSMIRNGKVRRGRWCREILSEKNVKLAVGWRGGVEKSKCKIKSAK